MTNDEYQSAIMLSEDEPQNTHGTPYMPIAASCSKICNEFVINKDSVVTGSTIHVSAVGSWTPWGYRVHAYSARRVLFRFGMFFLPFPCTAYRKIIGAVCLIKTHCFLIVTDAGTGWKPPRLLH